MSYIYGLSENEVRISREKYGTNEIKPQKKRSFISRFFENLCDPIIKILIFALIINIVFMLGNFDLLESIGIGATIIIATLVSTISEIGSERAFEKLDKEFENINVRVYREGNLKVVKSHEIVVGDFVLINSGDKIPADGIIISGEISVDQSSLTGETKEIRKFNSNSFEHAINNPSALFCGTLATFGNCIMKVTAISDQTYYGKTAKDLTSESPTSPLKEKLSKLAQNISYIGYIGAGIVALFNIFNSLFIQNNFDAQLIISSLKDVKYLSSILIKSLTTAITIIVVAVPEGLPMMITVVLSSNMKKMLKDNILIKKLVGIETAGSMNILFCDKTGTITSGKQSLNLLILGNLEETTVKKLKSSYPKIFELIHLASITNTECVITSKGIAGGNPTDRAICQAFSAYKIASKHSIISKVHFDSKKKFSAVKIKTNDNLVFYKGAPDKLLKHCSSYLNVNNQKSHINKELLQKTLESYEKESKRLCMIAMAEFLPDNDTIPELTLLSIAVISDPLRNNVKKAVKDIQGAGVQIVMITGDSTNTALAIAKSINIFNSQQDLVISTEELSNMSDSEVKKILPRLSVISRALPSDKRRIVKLAGEIGLVTGMTGDGINDSPALKLADIGFAMGSGTEVAKEAGDIVILNNDLKSIGKCMLYGRTVFESIKKFIVFQLTMNLCAVSVTILGPLMGINTPITMIQMLWINLIMDTIGALAFAGEAPLSDTMRQKPKNRNISIISKPMINKILFNGLFSLALCIIFITSNTLKDLFDYHNTPIKFYSGLFCLFVFAGIINAFTARSVRLNLFSGLAENKLFIIIMIGVSTVQLMMLYYGNKIFRTTPLDFKELIILICISLTLIPADLIRKLILKKLHRKYV